MPKIDLQTCVMSLPFLKCLQDIKIRQKSKERLHIQPISASPMIGLVTKSQENNAEEQKRLQN